MKYLKTHYTTPHQKSKKLRNKKEVEQMIQMLFEHHQLKQEIERLT